MELQIQDSDFSPRRSTRRKPPRLQRESGQSETSHSRHFSRSINSKRRSRNGICSRSTLRKYQKKIDGSDLLAKVTERRSKMSKGLDNRLESRTVSTNSMGMMSSVTMETGCEVASGGFVIPTSIFNNIPDVGLCQLSATDPVTRGMETGGLGKSSSRVTSSEPVSPEISPQNSQIVSAKSVNSKKLQSKNSSRDLKHIHMLESWKHDCGHNSTRAPILWALDNMPEKLNEDIEWMTKAKTIWAKWKQQSSTIRSMYINKARSNKRRNNAKMNPLSNGRIHKKEALNVTSSVVGVSSISEVFSGSNTSTATTPVMPVQSFNNNGTIVSTSSQLQSQFLKPDVQFYGLPVSFVASLLTSSSPQLFSTPCSSSSFCENTNISAQPKSTSNSFSSEHSNAALIQKVDRGNQILPEDHGKKDIVKRKVSTAELSIEKVANPFFSNNTNSNHRTSSAAGTFNICNILGNGSVSNPVSSSPATTPPNDKLASTEMQKCQSSTNICSSVHVNRTPHKNISASSNIGHDCTITTIGSTNQFAPTDGKVVDQFETKSSITVNDSAPLSKKPKTNSSDIVESSLTTVTNEWKQSLEKQLKERQSSSRNVSTKPLLFNLSSSTATLRNNDKKTKWKKSNVLSRPPSGMSCMTKSSTTNIVGCTSPMSMPSTSPSISLSPHAYAGCPQSPLVLNSSEISGRRSATPQRVMSPMLASFSATTSPASTPNVSSEILQKALKSEFDTINGGKMFEAIPTSEEQVRIDARNYADLERQYWRLLLAFEQQKKDIASMKERMIKARNEQQIMLLDNERFNQLKELVVSPVTEPTVPDFFDGTISTKDKNMSEIRLKGTFDRPVLENEDIYKYLLQSLS